MKYIRYVVIYIFLLLVVFNINNKVYASDDSVNRIDNIYIKVDKIIISDNNNGDNNSGDNNNDDNNNGDNNNGDNNNSEITQSDIVLAYEVYLGNYGNGLVRKQLFKKYKLNYNKIQSIVNLMVYENKYLSLFN